MPREVEVALYEDEERPANIIMAASQGAQTGVKLAVAVGAMVLAFVALVALANGFVGWAAALLGYTDVTFQSLLGVVFAPVFYLLAAPDWAEALRAGSFFGTKLVLNEFVCLHRSWAARQGAGGPVRTQRCRGDIRALRFCQFLLDRHPDGGHRGARA